VATEVRVLWLLVTANVPRSPIQDTPMMETIRPTETSVLTTAIRRNISEDGIVHSDHRENFKSYNCLLTFTLLFQFHSGAGNCWLSGLEN
jgi:hypothetical protein